MKREIIIIPGLAMVSGEFGVTVPTYIDEEGHTDPINTVKISVDQGICLKLPRTDPKSATGEVEIVDVYIERRLGKWTINISPDEIEIEAFIDVNDNGDTVTKILNEQGLYTEVEK